MATHASQRYNGSDQDEGCACTSARFAHSHCTTRMYMQKGCPKEGLKVGQTASCMHRSFFYSDFRSRNVKTVTGLTGSIPGITRACPTFGLQLRENRSTDRTAFALLSRSASGVPFLGRFVYTQHAGSTSKWNDEKRSNLPVTSC